MRSGSGQQRVARAEDDERRDFSSSSRCSDGYCVSALNILNVLGTPKRR